MSAPLVFYISAHGFGHASRDAEVINTLRALAPDLPIVVRTRADPSLLARSMTSPVEISDCHCDTGWHQFDSLRADEALSLQRADAFHRDLDDRATREADVLRRRRACGVVGDIPPLAFVAAAAAGVPSIALGNFTWDWIYEGFPEHVAAYPALLPTIRRAYARASLVLRLPMHGGFAGLEHLTRDIPLIVRRSRRTREEVRQGLGLPDRPLVLLSFGGHGLEGLDTGALQRFHRYAVVITDDASGRPAWPTAPSGALHAISMARLQAGGFRYEDLVHTADAIVTKPGYGIVSECIANETAMLYTSRGPFPEYEILVQAMARQTRSAFIPQDDLLAGRWETYLDRLLQSAPPVERPRIDGAEVAARAILDALRPA